MTGQCLHMMKQREVKGVRVELGSISHILKQFQFRSISERFCDVGTMLCHLGQIINDKLLRFEIEPKYAIYRSWLQRRKVKKSDDRWASLLGAVGDVVHILFSALFAF